MKFISNKLKFVYIKVWLICCLLFTACEKPQSGELEPVLVEGATLATSRFENDSLLFEENGLNVKFYGTWEGSIGLRIAIQNKTGKDASIKFEDFNVVNGNGTRSSVGGILENHHGDYRYLRFARVGNEENKEKPPHVTISAGSIRTFTVGFANLFNENNNEKMNTIFITLPIEIDDDKKIIKEFGPIFKKVNKKTKDMPDPSGW
jgi:hypothetical protein